MELKAKGVFLTGGARGIGRAICEALLNKGARVLFCDINVDIGKATEAELQKQYGPNDVIFAQCDVTNAEQLKATFQMAVSRFSAVDICVNNAGILDERIWEKMIEVNTMGQIRGSQLAMEHMRRDRGGRGGVIINTASVAGLIPAHWFPAYSASKHAVIGYTTSWANNPNTPAMGVRWCCLCPWVVNTELINVEDGQIFDRAGLRSTSGNAILKPEEVVEAFMRLVQDEDNNGAIMEVSPEKGSIYRRRQLVDRDGASNPMIVDQINFQPDSVK